MQTVGRRPILRRKASLGTCLFLGEGFFWGKDLNLETNDLILERAQQVERKKYARGKTTWKRDRQA